MHMYVSSFVSKYYRYTHALPRYIHVPPVRSAESPDLLMPRIISKTLPKYKVTSENQACFEHYHSLERITHMGTLNFREPLELRNHSDPNPRCC